jgi:hypothetical protein
MGMFRPGQSGTLFLALGVLAAALPGCSSGPPRGEVHGKVTFRGKPVSEGTIMFINPSGSGGSGETELRSDGTYEIQGGLIVGEYIVLVTPLMHRVDTSPGKTPPSLEEKPAPNIPTKYRRQASTPFRAKVEKGQNNPFDYDMTP